MSLPVFTPKSIPWRLGEFYYNTGQQRPYSSTCVIMQETVNPTNSWLLGLETTLGDVPPL